MELIRICIGLPIIIWLMCTCSSHTHEDKLYRWPQLSEAFDSINMMLDDASGNYISADSLWTLYNDMIDILERSNLDSIKYNQAKARTLYWKMKIFRQSNRDDSAANSLMAGLSLMDSTRYPYDWVRMRIALGPFSTRGFIKSLNGATQSCEYAAATEDPYLEGLARTNLAVYNMFLDNLDEALYNSRKAETLFRKVGKTRLADGTLVNTASILCQTGDTLEGVNILQNLMQSASCRRDTFIRLSALHVLGSVTNDLATIREGYSIVDSNSRFSQRKINFTMFLIRSLLANNLYEEALKVAFDNLRLTDEYVENARIASNSQDLDKAEYVYDFLARHYEAVGHLDSALYYYHKAWELSEWQREAFDLVSIKRVEASAELNRQKLNAQKILARQKLIWAGVIAVTLMLTLLIVSAATYRMQKIKLKHRESEIKAIKNQLEAERRARIAATSSLMLKEKDNVLETIKDHIDSSSKGEGLSEAEVKELKSVIATHYSTENEWEEFKLRFEEINPSFRQNFQQLYPNITLKDLDFVCLIKMGMSSKHIARVTGMLPDSIKKKRHRLRTKMNLSPDVDLEKIIQDIN